MPYPAMPMAEVHATLTAPGSPLEMIEAEIRGQKVRVWKNAPTTLREVFLAGRAHGEKTYIVYNDERVTFTAFARAAVKIAHELQALGVVKGDRVAIVMRNLPEWPVIFFGAILAGAIATQVNAWGAPAELEYSLADSGAKVAFLDPERLDRLGDRLDALPDLERVVVSRSAAALPPKVSRLEDWIGPSADWAALPDLPLPDIAFDPEDDATIFYTSGTTGKPKGALGTHRNSCSTLMVRPYGLSVAALRRGEPPPTPDPNAPQLSSLLSVPLFHTTGCQSTMIPMLAAGMKLVLMRKWDPIGALQLIERERINSAGGVPTIAWQLIEHPEFSKYDTSSLESFSYGGAPAAADLVRRLRSAKPAARLVTAWGMTETSAPLTVVIGEDYEARPETCGYPVPVCDMRIVGPDGADKPTGETGEIWVRGPNIVKGYWRNPEATEQTFGGGWLRTGDIGKLDEEGFCYIVDRAKDMLIRGGENIYCVEVENALAEHPDVLDAAVIGRPHPTLGEEPVAVVTKRRGAEIDDAVLRAFVGQRIASFKTPVLVLVREEMLPRNANGKIMKRELRKLFA